jgi:hypothetical protein
LMDFLNFAEYLRSFIVLPRLFVEKNEKVVKFFLKVH